MSVAGTENSPSKVLGNIRRLTLHFGFLHNMSLKLKDQRRTSVNSFQPASEALLQCSTFVSDIYIYISAANKTRFVCEDVTLVLRPADGPAARRRLAAMTSESAA